jgi:aryl-alcohol dehydrogenase-like predicted oxidoreductase
LIYHNLGRTGVKVSALCLGTMIFGIHIEEEEAISIINLAIENGINFIDTANVYGSVDGIGKGVGYSEEVIGKALKQNGMRDKIILTTKVFFDMDPNDPNAKGLSRHHIIQQCEASLERLQTKYIDLYQLHRPSEEIPIDETLRALDELIQSGKIRYIGTSEFSTWQIMEALWISERLKLNRFVSEQSFFNLIDRFIERERIPMAQKYGIAILPFSPLAGGALTGKYKRNMPYPENSRLSFEIGARLYASGLTERVFDLLDLMAELAEEKECTISQLALAWVMRQPGITSIIIGPRTQDQLMDNLGALNVTFSDEEYERIDKLAPPRSSIGGGLWHKGC